MISSQLCLKARCRHSHTKSNSLQNGSSSSQLPTQLVNGNTWSSRKRRRSGKKKKCSQCAQFALHCMSLSLCIAQPSRSPTYRMTRLTRGQSQSGPRATVRIGQDVPVLGGKPERQAATQVRAQQLEQSEPSSTKFSHLTISVSQSLLLPPSQQYYNRK